MGAKKHTKGEYTKAANRAMAHGNFREAAILLGKAFNCTKLDDADSLRQITLKRIQLLKDAKL